MTRLRTSVRVVEHKLGSEKNQIEHVLLAWGVDVHSYARSPDVWIQDSQGEETQSLSLARKGIRSRLVQGFPISLRVNLASCLAGSARQLNYSSKKKALGYITSFSGPLPQLFQMKWSKDTSNNRGY